MAAPHPTPEPLASLLSEYPRPAALPDEMIAPDGTVRPVWQPMLGHLAALQADGIGRRFARADKYLRDAGVFYRGYEAEGPSERDWPLSHIPVLLGEAEWAEIAAGIRQRAEVLEAVATDLYGPMKLIKAGMLPPDLIAQNPAWLRPLVGVRPRGGHFLNFLAFEIGRSRQGSWFVLGDRTEAPAGMGFALENRVATLLAFPDFPHDRLHRLAGFFRGFREALAALSSPDSGRPAILTPGPMAEGYFEHAYIARYLGLMLLEGEDLVVENGRALVRTVSGPQPVSILWRRLDATYADPLELDEHSQIGTPGLVGAVRDGSLSVVNALGAGVLQTRAMMAFLPRIAEEILGKPLDLPNIATWWCGQERERAYVREHAAEMTIGSAMSLDLPFEPDEDTAVAGKIPAAADGDLQAWIEAQSSRLVGQEAVTLSTTPAWRDDRLVPRPLMLRVFAARTRDGWEVMPGGYARIGNTTDVTALALRRGGAVSDVWIQADAPVQQESLALEGGMKRRATGGVLPSRAADNLYWLGRYAERTEHRIRLLRAYHLRLGETGVATEPEVTYLHTHLDAMGANPDAPLSKTIGKVLANAVRCAEKVRDRFS
ncbi:MAG: circularly permuted type 2 ATP-grasp protein, partial [Myxococcota bacterium]